MRTGIVAAVALGVGCGAPRPGPAPADDDRAGGADAALVTETLVAPAPVPEIPRSLFDRLGGEAGVGAIASDLVDRVVADPRIRERFFDVDPDELKAHVAELVCAGTGGACELARTRIGPYAGMDVIAAEYTAFVESLVAALDRHQVSEPDKAELFTWLAPFEQAVVARDDRLRSIEARRLAPVAAVAAKLDDPEARDLLVLAASVATRGQRWYAEVLFSRAELLVGPGALRGLAKIFRAGAPPRIETRPRAVPTDAPAQPALLGGSPPDERAAATAALRGTLTIAGARPDAPGVVMLWPEKGRRTPRRPERRAPERRAPERRAPERRAIEQRGRAFAPHVLAVPVGSTVAFPNFDTAFHNVFSLDRPRPFDLGLYRHGDSREVRFDRAGIARIGCNLHADMAAYVVVVDAPHYVVVGADGAFELARLVPGAYRVRAWSEAGAAPVDSRVVLAPGANTVELVLAPTTRSLGPDKFGVPRATRLDPPARSPQQ